ncbi:MAG: 50S ribosomal protein L19e [Candidatus Aenigmatarchaeota archaeon]
MDLKSQKNMAARILGCGKSRIWIDPSRVADVAEAITANDIRKFINDGIIKVIPKSGLSSFRKKKLIKQKSKGRRKGIGTRKGCKGARTPKKKIWMKRIRTIRKLLRELKNNNKIDNKTYREMYNKSKSGFFRNKSHVMIYLQRNKLLKEDIKEDKK